MIQNVNQLTEQLRMLPDAALQRVAMMYKDDAIVLPLVASESSARKKVRAAAQAQMAQPQPKVNEQAIMAMAPQPPAPGIAALQAPNMQSMADGGIAGYPDDDDGSLISRNEPVVRMAGGGVPGYKDGGAAKAKNTFIEQYRDLAEQVGSETGVDPALILSQWGLESAWGTKTVGQFNFGNIKDVTGKGPRAEDKAEGSTDAYKTYKSPQEFAADYTSLLKRNFPKALGAGSDLGKFTEGLSKGRTGTYATDPAYAMKVGRVYSDLKETLPERVPSDAGYTAAPLTVGGALTGIEGLMFGNFAHELEKARFKPGTTPGQAIRQIAVGTGAVPAAVLGGGTAASLSATSTMGRMAPEQRAQFYQNPMIGAMSPDDAFAAAIMNAAQGQPIKPPATALPYAQQMERAAKTVVSAPGKAIAAVPGAVVDTIAGKPKEYGPSLGYDWAPDTAATTVDPSDPRLKNLAKDLKKEAPPEVKQTAKEEGWSKDDWMALAAGLLTSKSPFFGEAVGQGIAGVLQSRQAREKAAREKMESESMAEYRKAAGREAAARAAELEAGRSATAMRQKAVALAQQDLEKDIQARMLPVEQQQQWLQDRARAYMQLIGVPTADTMASAGGGDYKVLGVRPST
jgi:flagellum-specific peptidoglycan hydrolase FlgJ